jgi:hypothetical protein
MHLKTVHSIYISLVIKMSNRLYGSVYTVCVQLSAKQLRLCGKQSLLAVGHLNELIIQHYCII